MSLKRRAFIVFLISIFFSSLQALNFKLFKSEKRLEKAICKFFNKQEVEINYINITSNNGYLNSITNKKLESRAVEVPYNIYTHNFRNDLYQNLEDLIGFNNQIVNVTNFGAQSGTYVNQ
jgi:hypothetical protein